MSDWSLEVEPGRVLAVSLRFSRRRTVALHLRPGPLLELRAPRGCPRDVLEAFLLGRREWVRRHLETLPPPSPSRTYSDGEAHRFLGRSLRLQIAACRRRRVERRGEFLWVSLPDPGRRDHVRDLLRRWYSLQAERIFTRRLAQWRRRLRVWELPSPVLRCRRMRRRWGSCSTTGVITLNTRLVERSPALIDFVVVHELCHLREFRHSPRFYGLMSEAMPGWRDRAHALDRGDHGIGAEPD